jgi:(5-formylfuran-3-yl)methyl phosphate transaminase
MDDILHRFTGYRDRGTGPPVNLCMGSSAFDVRSQVSLALEDPEVSLSAYLDPRGIAPLREAIAKYYLQQHKVVINPDRIIVTDGALGAIHISFLLLAASSDEVLVPEIAFPVFRDFIAMRGAHAVSVPADYDLAAVRAAVTSRTRALVVNSPSNPLGTVVSRTRLEALCSLGIPVISDEVYVDFGFDVEAPSAVPYADDHFIVGSLSKAFGVPALRIGYLVVPPRWLEPAIAIKATTNVCTSLPAQLLARRLLAAGDRIIAAHREHVRQNRDHVVSWCEREGLRLRDVPAAGFYCNLFPDTPIAGGSLALARRLVDELGVAVFPGSDFADPDPGFVRINYARSQAELDMALPRLKALLTGAARPS